MRSAKVSTKLFVALISLAIAVSLGTVAYAYHWRNSHPSNFVAMNNNVPKQVPVQAMCHQGHHGKAPGGHVKVRVVKVSGEVVKVNVERRIIVLETEYKNRTVNLTLKVLPVYVNNDNGALTYSQWILMHLSEGSKVTAVALLHRSAHGINGLLIGIKGEVGTFISPKGFAKISRALSAK